MRPLPRPTRVYPLENVRTLIELDQCRATKRAISDAHRHGFSETDIYEIVLSLSVRDFVHSVSENGSNKIWQDVYKIVRNDVHLFIKFKIVSIGEEELLVLSFHDDTDD